MIFENIVKISLIVIVSLFILILVVKRFAYYHPSTEFLPERERYQDIMEGNVNAWVLKHEKNKKIILFCHGNAGNISHRQDKMIQLHNLGYDVLIFDYTGFGRSKGIPSEDKCYHNASMFANILIEEYGKENIILYGESLGAAIASYVVLKYNLPYLILESGLPGIKTYLMTLFKPLALIAFLFNDFNTNSYIKKYNGKILVLHCINDEIITWDSTFEMRNRANKVIQMSGSHNDPVIPWNEIKEFIEKD